MIITDYNKIKEAKAIYPDIMSDDAELKIKEKYCKFRDAENDLARMRIEVRNKAEEVVQLKEEYNKLSSLFNITFESKEIDEIKNEVSLQVINPDDYRNHN